MSQELQNIKDCLALRRARLCKLLADARKQNKQKTYIDAIKEDRRQSDRLYSQVVELMKKEKNDQRNEELREISIQFKRALISDTIAQ